MKSLPIYKTFLIATLFTGVLGVSALGATLDAPTDGSETLFEVTDLGTVGTETSIPTALNNRGGS